MRAHNSNAADPPLTIPGTEPVVTITRRKHSTLVHGGDDRRISRLISRAVPTVGRERDPITGDWIIFASRADRLLAALRTAGYQVREVAA